MSWLVVYLFGYVVSVLLVWLYLYFDSEFKSSYGVLTIIACSVSVFSWLMVLITIWLICTDVYYEVRKKS